MIIINKHRLIRCKNKRLIIMILSEPRDDYNHTSVHNESPLGQRSITSSTRTAPILANNFVRDRAQIIREIVRLAFYGWKVRLNLTSRVQHTPTLAMDLPEYANAILKWVRWKTPCGKHFRRKSRGLKTREIKNMPLKAHTRIFFLSTANFLDRKQQESWFPTWTMHSTAFSTPLRAIRSW